MPRPSRIFTSIGWILKIERYVIIEDPDELEMFLNDPVHQREIEEKRGSGKRTVQMFKRKRNEYGSKYASWGFDSVCRYDGGAACVFLKNELKPIIQKTLLGFASGVMVAASVWSLLIPSMNMCEAMGHLAFLPASIGFMVGVF